MANCMFCLFPIGDYMLQKVHPCCVIKQDKPLRLIIRRKSNLTLLTLKYDSEYVRTIMFIITVLYNILSVHPLYCLFLPTRSPCIWRSISTLLTIPVYDGFFIYCIIIYGMTLLTLNLCNVQFSVYYLLFVCQKMTSLLIKLFTEICTVASEAICSCLIGSFVSLYN